MPTSISPNTSRSLSTNTNIPALRSEAEFFMGGIMPVDTQQGDCTICTEALSTDVVKVIACEHIFHLMCLLHWFQSDNARHESCPICRRQLFNSGLESSRWNHWDDHMFSFAGAVSSTDFRSSRGYEEPVSWQFSSVPELSLYMASPRSPNRRRRALRRGSSSSTSPPLNHPSPSYSTAPLSRTIASNFGSDTFVNDSTPSLISRRRIRYHEGNDETVGLSTSDHETMSTFDDRHDITPSFEDLMENDTRDYDVSNVRSLGSIRSPAFSSTPTFAGMYTQSSHHALYSGSEEFERMFTSSPTSSVGQDTPPHRIGLFNRVRSPLQYFTYGRYYSSEGY